MTVKEENAKYASDAKLHAEELQTANKGMREAKVELRTTKDDQCSLRDHR